jgi:hypothetical protein
MDGAFLGCCTDACCEQSCLQRGVVVLKELQGKDVRAGKLGDAKECLCMCLHYPLYVDADGADCILSKPGP